MAEFSCDACGRNGGAEHDETHHGCPICGSSDAVFLLAIEELPDELLDALLSIPADDGGRDDD